MKKANIIKNQLDKSAGKVYLSDNEWNSMPFNAFVTHLWRRKSSAFEPEYTELGAVSPEYYLYIGPYNHDITALSDDLLLHMDGSCFEFKRRDAVKFCDETIYYTGILQKLKGEGAYDARITD